MEETGWGVRQNSSRDQVFSTAERSADGSRGPWPTEAVWIRPRRGATLEISAANCAAQGLRAPLTRRENLLRHRPWAGSRTATIIPSLRDGRQRLVPSPLGRMSASYVENVAF